MPKVSIRQQTIKVVNKKFEQSAYSDDDEEVEEMSDLRFGLEKTRVLNSSESIPKLSQFREYISKWSNEEFVNLIRYNDVFKNDSLCNQTDVYVQLGVTLKRFGHDGTGNSINQLAGYLVSQKDQSLTSQTDA